MGLCLRFLVKGGGLWASEPSVVFGGDGDHRPNLGNAGAARPLVLISSLAEALLGAKGR